MRISTPPPVTTAIWRQSRPSSTIFGPAKIATVIASGNEYANGQVNAPGCISSAVTVGSTTKANQLSDFSNHSKLVDLLAPGTNIFAAAPGGAYQSLSGTSMATPHVAGAWAVLKQAKPGASVQEIQARTRLHRRRGATCRDHQAAHRRAGRAQRATLARARLRLIAADHLARCGARSIDRPVGGTCLGCSPPWP